jgi:ATP-dependent 26S proteasome regulatory subunit
MIDQAVMRLGRFDPIIKISSCAEEIRALPCKNFYRNCQSIERSIRHRCGRNLLADPFSDVVHVVREGARLAARSGESQLGQQDRLAAARGDVAKVFRDKAQPYTSGEAPMGHGKR